jgi:hypothetical protein
MSQIDYLDKYDKEFVNLMLEINNNIDDFSKLDKLKINSWIKSLCLPTNNIPWKKNRNLYTLKLLDNVLNSKLEKPFTKYADFGDNLPMLDPILIKSGLSNKINFIINNIHSDEQIQNFIEANMQKNNNIENNKEINYDLINKNIPVYRAKTPSSSMNILNKRNNLINNYKKENKNFYGNNKPFFSNKKFENNSDIFYKGDQLLNKNYFDFDKKLSKEPGYYKKTKINTDFEKKRLQATIAELQNECEIKNQLINQQELDIIKLKNRVTQLEKKVKFVFKK